MMIQLQNNPPCICNVLHPNFLYFCTVHMTTYSLINMIIQINLNSFFYLDSTFSTHRKHTFLVIVELRNSGTEGEIVIIFFMVLC